MPTLPCRPVQLRRLPVYPHGSDVRLFWGVTLYRERDLMIHGNYHTHTYRCKHAEGDIEDYCREAVRQGLTSLGFSDHTPLPDGRWDSVRMSMAELPGYCEAIAAAREQFPGLRILKALECEYIAEFSSVYRDLFLGQWGMDYLVGAAHWYPYQGAWNPMYGLPMDASMLRAYTDYIIETIQSDLFAFIAHPDLLGNAYLVWDDEVKACSRDMLTLAAEKNLPVEINGYGFRKPMIETPTGPRLRYPWLPFWELAGECGAPVVVNSDAHRPVDVNGNMDEALAIATRFDLRVVEDPCGIPS